MSRRLRVSRAAVAAACIAPLVLSSCAETAPPVSPETTPESSSRAISLPPENAIPDYQLGGAYPPVADVQIVARDRTDPPADGVYSICYVNGFQSQPGELGTWPTETLLQRDGDLVVDPDWPDEVLLDTSTSEKRRQIIDMVSPWIIGCAEDGYDAVEFDNLDSYTRSDGALTLDQNLALAAELVAVAHDVGLAAGQKNAAEDTVVLREQAGFDFAVTEECAAYRECGTYTAVYGSHVIDIEYTAGTDRSFAELCAQAGSPSSMVHRDRDLTLPGDATYVFETCDRT